LEIDPQAIDVNIHPTKTEIKFEDDSVVFQIVYACIKEALGKNSFGESIDFDREGVPDIPAFGKNFDEFRAISEPQLGQDDSFNPFDNDGFPSIDSPYSNSLPSSGSHVAPQGDVWGEGGGFELGGHPAGEDFGMPSVGGYDRPSGYGSGYGAGTYVAQRDDYGKLFEDKLAPGRSVLVLQGKYVLTTSKGGLMVINVKRAMERILYDRFLEAMSRNAHITQTALFPVTVQVGVENMCLFEEHSQMLAALGFDIAPFGTDTIVVNGVPEGYSAEPGKVQTMVGDLLLILAEDHNALPEMMMANLASRFARLGSLSSDQLTNPAEAQRLIDTLFASENPEYTSSGRRIVSILSMDDIDKKF
jgi:DNA mismatch repair protein MutL